jgi:hypothetical protein
VIILNIIRKEAKKGNGIHMLSDTEQLIKLQFFRILTAVEDSQNINAFFALPIIQCIMLGQDAFSDFFLFKYNRELLWIGRNLDY